MTISPETLTDEPREQQLERQRRTGVYGPGLTVLCRPDPMKDPEVVESQHRVVCLGKPYPACVTCRHSEFELIFRADNRERLQETVACPRWKNMLDRLDGKHPEEYVTTDLATCAKKPFEFCTSCPSRDEVEKYSANKMKDGWYGRWHRLRKLEFEDDDD